MLSVESKAGSISCFRRMISEVPEGLYVVADGEDFAGEIIAVFTLDSVSPGDGRRVYVTQSRALMFTLNECRLNYYPVVPAPPGSCITISEETK